MNSLAKSPLRIACTLITHDPNYRAEALKSHAYWLNRIAKHANATAQALQKTVAKSFTPEIEFTGSEIRMFQLLTDELETATEALQSLLRGQAVSSPNLNLNNYHGCHNTAAEAIKAKEL